VLECYSQNSSSFSDKYTLVLREIRVITYSFGMINISSFIYIIFDFTLRDMKEPKFSVASILRRFLIAISL